MIRFCIHEAVLGAYLFIFHLSKQIFNNILNANGNIYSKSLNFSPSTKILNNKYKRYINTILFVLYCNQGCTNITISQYHISHDTQYTSIGYRGLNLILVSGQITFLCTVSYRFKLTDTINDTVKLYNNFKIFFLLKILVLWSLLLTFYF